MGAKKASADTVSSKPLFDWFRAERKRRSAFRAAGYSDGRITNWKSRGIPRAELGRVANIMGMTYEEYLAAAGVEVKGGYGLRLQLEEAEAIKRLRNAIPDWRRYVLGLAMIDSHESQAIFLKTMRQAVPDRRVEKAFGDAPHVAARRQVKEPRE